MGACLSADTKATEKPTNDAKICWEVMVQSHQALYAALDHMKNTTMTLKRDKMDDIRKEADWLFMMMKIHAKIEDSVYFPAFNDFRPGIASSFSDDHKKSAEGRPKLLELLNNAKSSDSAFEEAMAALRKFCDGNRAHQEREEVALDPFKPLFPPKAIKDLFARLAALDPEPFNTIYVDGIYSNLPDSGKKLFLAGLEYAVPPEQFSIISNTVKKSSSTAPMTHTASSTPVSTSTISTGVSPWEIMVQSHQGLFAALDHMKETTKVLKRDSMEVIRKEADHLFLMMKIHAKLEDTVYFPAFNAFQEHVAESFSEDHKKSGEGRPKLLELLDNAKNSDEAFEEGMNALRKFCDGNRAHQEREEIALDPLKPRFTPAGVKDLFIRLCALDPQSFNTTYVAGIYKYLPESGRKLFLGALEATVPVSQYAEIQKTIDTCRALPWEIMVQSHQGLYARLDHMKQTTMSLKRDSMDQIRQEADQLFLMMKLHARIEDTVYFPPFNGFQEHVADSFSEDHKKSGEGRPKLLELLDNAKNSDEAFEEGMNALRKFCDGNRAHQEREEVNLDPLKPRFDHSTVLDIFVRLAALDAPSFNTTYVPGIIAYLPENGKKLFIDSLEYCLPKPQYAEIHKILNQ